LTATYGAPKTSSCRIWRAGAEIEVPDDQVRPSPGDPQAGDKALLDVERQRRVRAIDGILAAFLAFIGLSVRLAAAAGGTAGKTEAFRPVIRLLQFFRREAVLCGFRCHGGSSGKMFTGHFSFPPRPSPRPDGMDFAEARLEHHDLAGMNRTSAPFSSISVAAILQNR
jgi:hypothetical protein